MVRAVLQRVSQASVSVDGEIIGSIQRGICALIGSGHGDNEQSVDSLAKKILNLRIFPDEEGKMNLSLVDIGGGLLLVPQFTLYGDARKGNRPSFVRANAPDDARRLFDDICTRCQQQLGGNVEKGQFQADMRVSLVNEGPVTILLDTEKAF